MQTPEQVAERALSAVKHHTSGYLSLHDKVLAARTASNLLLAYASDLENADSGTKTVGELTPMPPGNATLRDVPPPESPR